MSSKIKCVVCGGKNFRRGSYEVETDIDIHSMASSDATHKRYNYDDPEVNIDVITTVYNEVSSTSNLNFTIEPDDENSYVNFTNIYKYICEECGYIMSFTKKHNNVESKKEEKERKQKERMHDWTNTFNQQG